MGSEGHWIHPTGKLVDGRDGFAGSGLKPATGSYASQFAQDLLGRQARAGAHRRNGPVDGCIEGSCDAVGGQAEVMLRTLLVGVPQPHSDGLDIDDVGHDRWNADERLPARQRHVLRK